MTEKRVAIVTAASKGMGRACALELAVRGYDLVILARSEAIQDLASEIGAQAVMGSVTEPGVLESAVDCAMSQFGRIDAVVNNTGHPPKGPLLEIPDSDWHAGLELIVLNVIRMARLVTPIMAIQGGGAIVNISTFAAQEPSLAFPVSSSIRAALSAFTKLYADDQAANGIRMNSVLPGFVDSYPVDEDILANIPTGRAGTTAEIAQTVAFLLSDEASYITGQNVRVDGGLGRST